LWWNVFGFFATVLSGYFVSFAVPIKTAHDPELNWSIERYQRFGFKINWLPRYVVLLLWFIGLVVFLHWVSG
jgi:hypothetical protein